MLPGFRFLFAAIVLSMSILVFGLGAAALLRSAHEEFASIPSRHAAPETVFVAPPSEAASEATRPVLAMLRIEPPSDEQRAPGNIPAAAAPAEPAAIASTPIEPEAIGALSSEDPSSPETAKTEIPAAESPDRVESAADQTDAAASIGDTKIAANEAISSPPNETVPAAAEPMSTLVSSDIAATMPAIASTKIATLGGPPVITGTQPPAKVLSAKPGQSTIKKAPQAARRRKIARVAQQAPQQPADSFAKPAAQPVTTARKR